MLAPWRRRSARRRRSRRPGTTGHSPPRASGGWRAAGRRFTSPVAIARRGVSPLRTARGHRRAAAQARRARCAGRGRARRRVGVARGRVQCSPAAARRSASRGAALTAARSRPTGRVAVAARPTNAARAPRRGDPVGRHSPHRRYLKRRVSSANDDARPGRGINPRPGRALVVTSLARRRRRRYTPRSHEVGPEPSRTRAAQPQARPHRTAAAPTTPTRHPPNPKTKPQNHPTTPPEDIVPAHKASPVQLRMSMNGN